MSDQTNQNNSAVQMTAEQRLQENTIGRGRWINILLGCLAVLVVAAVIYVLAGAAVSGVTSLAGLVWVVKGGVTG